MGSGSPEQQPHTPGGTENFVSVSTSFYPGASHYTGDTDIVLLSQDSVWFYVESQKLMQSSNNSFDSLMPPSRHSNSESYGPLIIVAQPSTVFNIVLHAIYDISCSQYSPSFDDISAAVSALDGYGISLYTALASETALFSLLKSYAPVVPLDLYTLAASYDLYDLALLASQYLHSLNLSSITDELAEKIGPIYLKRLFFLHYGRADALKRILSAPPHPHAPTRDCDFVDQKKLTSAWSLAAAYLAWDARAGVFNRFFPYTWFLLDILDISTSTIESALNPLGHRLPCQTCRDALMGRIKTLIADWANIRVCCRIFRSE